MYKLLFIVVYVLIYYFLIYKLTKKHMDTTKETINMFKTDFYTSQYFIVFFLTTLVSLVYYFFNTNYWAIAFYDILIMLLIILSGVIEYSGIKALKDNYYPQVGPEKQLITTGIFKTIRHPVYLAALLLGAGLILLLSPTLFWYLFPFIIISVIVKVEMEEKYLLKRFKGYKSYKKKTWKLIPRIY